MLLLDFYIPPQSGAQVLKAVLDASQRREIVRPRTIIGMSSMDAANRSAPERMRE